MESPIEINIVFVQYEQNSFNGFNLELLELAEKWKLQTKTSAFTVTQHPKEPQVKTVRKSKRLQKHAIK
jgi:hypothetical protein